MEVKSKVFISDEDNVSYFVFIDTMVLGEVSSFILHCSGNARKLRRLYLRIKNRLHKDIYYRLKNVDEGEELL